MIKRKPSGKKLADLNGVLFLIGSSGARGKARKYFSKEQKAGI